MPDITIEWGDGTTEECTTIQPTHTYTDAGTYVIKIAGNMPRWQFSEVSTSKDYITGLKQWGNIGIVYISFSGCTNLEGTIPKHKTKGEFAHLYSVSFLFNNCNKITGKIPEDLFEGSGKLCYAVSVFYGCTGLTGNIPKYLLKDTTKIATLNGFFRHCSGITGKIPEDLFKNCAKASNFSLIFKNTSITEIPADIFDINNGQPNGIKMVYGAFCGTLITQIPEGIFDLCVNIEKFGEITSTGNAHDGVFQNCKLLEKVPEKLFYKNTKAVNFGCVFYGCSSLKEIPENIFNTSQPNVIMNGSFEYCSSLTKIPGKIFENVPNISDYKLLFGDCPNLIEIGKEFKISDSAINMYGTFRNCDKLSVFPDKIIIPENVNNIILLFNKCRELKTTILLKTNSAEHDWSTFLNVNSESRVNWSSPCTEEFVDTLLTTSGNTAIKGVQE